MTFAALFVSEKRDPIHGRQAPPASFPTFLLKKSTPLFLWTKEK